MLDPEATSRETPSMPDRSSTARGRTERARRTGTFESIAFAFAAGCFVAAAFQAFSSPSKVWIPLVVSLPWLLVALPYCVLRDRQGRSTLSWSGLRDSVALGLGTSLVLAALGTPQDLDSLMEVATRLAPLHTLFFVGCLLGHGVLHRLSERRPVDTGALAFAAASGGTILVASTLL